jgi:hypothetical protein
MIFLPFPLLFTPAIVALGCTEAPPFYWAQQVSYRSISVFLSPLLFL